jgi:hypothetical protein
VQKLTGTFPYGKRNTNSVEKGKYCTEKMRKKILGVKENKTQKITVNKLKVFRIHTVSIESGSSLFGESGSGFNKN